MMRLWMPTLVTGGEAERLPAVRVSWNYFDTVGARPALGRGFTPEDDREDGWRVALLSDRLWRRRFGADPSIVGRTVALHDQPFRVIGVMPASFEPLDAQRYFNTAAEIWVPIGNDQSTCRRQCRPVRALGRLKPGVTIDAATAEMNGIREQLRREHPADYEAGAISVVALHRALTGEVRAALYVLLAAVGFVLLIACANVANLLLARAGHAGPRVVAARGARRRPGRHRPATAHREPDAGRRRRPWRLLLASSRSAVSRRSRRCRCRGWSMSRSTGGCWRSRRRSPS